MKTTILLSSLLLTLLAGCSEPTNRSPVAEPGAAAPAAQPTPASSPAMTSASATGVVTAVDPSAKTVTIEHGPVAALKWPAMTMTFQAPDADMTAIKAGDRVSFDFNSSGMDGTITALRQQ
ncbi:MAG: copper-binding protein [Pseudomonadota bacterium]|nr:copper-binding protein [Pseudomonadota bacterium]MDQ3160690.1 copper-binding protein [Pseudomonadota bacterium]